MINIKNKKLIIAQGNHIRALRIKKRLSQEGLANEADIPLSQIGRIERGESNPTISTLYVISEALEIELKVFLDFKVGK